MCLIRWLTGKKGKSRLNRAEWGHCIVVKLPLQIIIIIMRSPLWSCQKQREWCHVLLWRDTRQPAAPRPELWSCPGGRRGLETDAGRQVTHSLSHTQMHSPGIPAVETEGDLVHAARVSHHQVKTGLKAEGRHKNWNANIIWTKNK